MFIYVYICILIGDVMDSVVVSVRIKKAVKLELEKEGIDVESAVKEYLVNRAAQLQWKKAVERMTKIIKTKVKPSKEGFAVKSIREDRDVVH